MTDRVFHFSEGDIVGSRRLTSDAFIATNRRTSYRWECVICGSVGVMAQVNLKQSVACCNDWYDRGRDRLRVVWDDMHNRCYDRNHPAYPRYGGSGVTVSGWADYLDFRSWALDQGYRYRDGLDLDRTNNESGYSPSNCRFVSRMKNANNRSNTKYLTVGGTTLPVTEWSRLTGIQSQTIIARVERYGWAPEDAVKRDAQRSRL